MEKETAKIPGLLLALVGSIAIAAISLWYGQNNHLMPEHASQQAPMLDDIAIAAISLWYGQNNHLMPEHASQQAPIVDDFLT
jgi:heme/copper-type cytochrome/quinol oxidase subunit 2